MKVFKKCLKCRELRGEFTGVKLESNGIIVKLNHPDSKAKVLYQLTQKGIDLLPIMIEIHLWADKYSTIPPERNAIIKELKNNKEAFIKSYTEQLKKRQLGESN